MGIEGPESVRCAGPVSHAIFRVARLHRMLAGQLLRRVGLHPGQELLLMHLWDTGPQRQLDLVTLLDSDSATITRMVQRLERAGFVRRHRCPDDGRGVVVEPTAASQALRRDVERMWRELERATLDGLDADDTAAVRSLLGTLESNLSAATATDER